MNAGKIRRMAKIEQFIAKESDDITGVIISDCS